MKILVTGSKGQLGNEIRLLAHAFPDYEFVFTDLPELDLTSETDVQNLVSTEKPAVIINCAAYTAVDGAEEEPEAAFRINAGAVETLASAAAGTGAFMMHVSTDYVFNGRGTSPYKETDPPAPVSVYGASKFEGERRLQLWGKPACIIRTSWLYSAHGHNFVRTMLKLGREKESVNVVADQLGCPTSASDLAQAIMVMIPQIPRINKVEIFHYCNQGTASWFEFAKEIFRIAGISCLVNPIRTEEFPTAAIRPAYSVLDTSKIRSAFGLEIPPWQESLKLCVQRLMPCE